MDRLTYRDADGRAKLTLFGKQMYCSTQATADCFAKLEESLAAYKDTGLEPKEITEYLSATDEYVRASEEGRLIVLPCKVGDTVWRIVDKCQSDDCPFAGGRGIQRCHKGGDYYNYCGSHIEKDVFSLPMLESFNKAVFRSREEAEAALGGDGDAV